MSTAGLLLAAAEEGWANKLRTALAMLSVTIGVATLTLIVALGETGRAAATVIIERQSGRAVTIALNLGGISATGRDSEYWIHRMRDRASRLGAISVSANQPGNAMLRLGDRSSSVQLLGVDPEMASIRRFRVVAGRWLDVSDANQRAPTLVLNLPAAADLGFAATSRDRPTLQSDIELSTLVVGIVDDASRIGQAYLPVRKLLQLVNPPSEIGFLAWLPPGRDAAIATQLARDTEQWGVTLEVQRLDDPRPVEETIQLFQLVFGAIAAVSLVAGGLGILNLGLVTTRQRAQEFGVRRAFGASTREVFQIVLLEAILTTVTAGFVGVLVAALGVRLVPVLAIGLIQAADLPPFPLFAVAVGLTVSVTVGVIAGAIPAIRATRVQVIEAIRN